MHQILEGRFTPQRLWKEFRLGMSADAGVARFDIAADVAQASLCAVSLVVGRSLRVDDYPAGLPALLMEVVEIAQIRGSASFAAIAAQGASSASNAARRARGWRRARLIPRTSRSRPRP